MWGRKIDVRSRHSFQGNTGSNTCSELRSKSPLAHRMASFSAQSALTSSIEKVLSGLASAPIRVFDIEGDAAHWMRKGAEFCDLGGSPGQLVPDEPESCRVKCEDDLVGFPREDGGEVPHESVLEFEKIARANPPAGKVVAEQVAELLQVLRVHRE